MSEKRPAGPTPDEQAAIWFARRRGDAFGAQDEAGLRAWLAADPANARAFAEIQQLWQDLGHLPRPARVTAASARRPRWRARAVAAVLSGLLVLLPVWLGGPAEAELSLASGAAERREMELIDGSRIHLNRNTRLEVRLLADRREVELLQGEAFFSVAADAGRPFLIRAGEGSVRVLGTRFDVRRGDGRLDVTVESGRVALRPQPDAAVTELVAGNRAAYDYRRGELLLTQVTGDEVASWREGRLVFQQRPLAQLLDELSHYRSAPVVLADPALAGRQVSGSIDLARPDDFLEALPALLPVRVEHRDDGGVRVSPR